MKYPFIISLILLFFFNSCLNKPKSLGRWSSSSIEKSKQRKVFLFEYKPCTININDTIHFKILSIFAERQYGEYSYSDPTLEIDKYKSQVVLIFENNLWEINGYSCTWDFENLSYEKPNKFSMLYGCTTPPDSIQVRIIKKIDTKDKNVRIEKNYVIGKFLIIKK